jgi:large subunit ribosomal protein L21e
MPGGQGQRHRTRHLFQRGFRAKGYINLTTYLRTFKLGDYVDIKVNGAVHKVRGPPGPPGRAAAAHGPSSRCLRAAARAPGVAGRPLADVGAVA